MILVVVTDGTEFDVLGLLGIPEAQLGCLVEASDNLFEVRDVGRLLEEALQEDFRVYCDEDRPVEEALRWRNFLIAFLRGRHVFAVRADIDRSSSGVNDDDTLSMLRKAKKLCKSRKS